jgi:hypothetical protein
MDSFAICHRLSPIGNPVCGRLASRTHPPYQSVIDQVWVLGPFRWLLGLSPRVQALHGDPALAVCPFLAPGRPSKPSFAPRSVKALAPHPANPAPDSPARQRRRERTIGDAAHPITSKTAKYPRLVRKCCNGNKLPNKPQAHPAAKSACSRQGTLCTRRT